MGDDGLITRTTFVPQVIFLLVVLVNAEETLMLFQTVLIGLRPCKP
jgi:hypothetical protein